MYCPKAMASRPDLTLLQASWMLWEIILIASKWNISERVQAPLVIYPSIAWVKASIPVAAVKPFGIVPIISGSTTAIIGISCGSTHTNFLWRSSSVIT